MQGFHLKVFSQEIDGLPVGWRVGFDGLAVEKRKK
jgi:hypothetical protein